MSSWISFAFCALTQFQFRSIHIKQQWPLRKSTDIASTMRWLLPQLWRLGVRRCTPKTCRTDRSSIGNLRFGIHFDDDCSILFLLEMVELGCAAPLHLKVSSEPVLGS